MPTLAPPGAARGSVLAAMGRAAAAETTPGRLLAWLPAAGLAAVALLAAVVLTSLARGPVETGDSLAGAAALRPATDVVTGSSYGDLIAQSRRLEDLLAELPAQRRLMRADTASTIAALETQLAVIDDQLTLGSIAGITSEDKRELWQERVDAMSALVQVRFVQSREFVF